MTYYFSPELNAKCPMEGMLYGCEYCKITNNCAFFFSTSFGNGQSFPEIEVDEKNEADKKPITY